MADNSMKYGIIYCGYNTEEYVVDSITPFLERDNFVVSAVSVPFAEYKEVDDLEDSTTDILRELVTQRKLRYLVDQPRFVQEHEARNHALAHLSKYNVDYIWLVDSDEIYTPDQIDKICEHVEATQGNFFKLSLKNFVFDKSHYLKEPFCPPRIFKTQAQNLPLCGFYWDNDIAYLEALSGNLISYEGINGIETIPPEVAFIDHYSWLNNEIGKRKVAYQLKHFGHCSYKWNEKKECLEFDENFYKKNKQEIPIVKCIK